MVPRLVFDEVIYRWGKDTFTILCIRILLIINISVDNVDFQYHGCRLFFNATTWEVTSFWERGLDIFGREHMRTKGI